MSTLSASQLAIASVQLTIVDRPIGDLRPNPRSPRTHSKAQLRKLGQSIKAFGFVTPILVDGNGMVVAGHARLLAARDLGLATVPTINLNHLSPAQLDAFMVADNRLAELSSWDDHKLGEILLDLSVLNLDFSLEATGFEMAEIDLHIEAFQAIEPAPAADKADTVPPVGAGPAVSKLGDLWLLDRHRVLCGSALHEPDYRRLMGEEEAAGVFTDPPYNVPIAGHVSGLGAFTHREFAMGVGEMSRAEFIDFLKVAFGNLARFTRDGSLHYLCMDWRHTMELQAAADGVYSEQKNLCVWVKSNGGMGSLYRSQHELIFVYKNGTAPHRNNVELGRHGRNRTNVWNYPGIGGFGRKAEEGNLLALHPTVKPVQLVADALLDSTARGEVVLDCFLGSGSTLMAAERVGRRCFGLELDPLYVDTIIRRWQAYTGDTARHADTGISFAEAAAASTAGQGGVS